VGHIYRNAISVEHADQLRAEIVFHARIRPVRGAAETEKPSRNRPNSSGFAASGTRLGSLWWRYKHRDGYNPGMTTLEEPA